MILNIIYHVCIVMKISFEGGLVILLFIVVILYANFGGSSYIPYTKDSLFSHMYPYEGFTDFPSAVLPETDNLADRPLPGFTMNSPLLPDTDALVAVNPAET